MSTGGTGPGPNAGPGTGLGGTVKDEEKGHNAAGDKANKGKEAKKVEKKRAEKVDSAQREAADGDVQSFNPAWNEPQGTVHGDQFNTTFPGEKRARQG